MSLLAIFKKARALLRKGWTQHAYADRSIRARTCYCLAGALNAAAGRQTAEGLPSAEYRALGFRAESPLLSWNDRKGRRQEEVLARLDGAIKKLREARG